MVVKAGVEHDDGEGQHVARIWGESGPRGVSAGPARDAPTCARRPQPALTRGLEDAGVAQAVASRERFHHAVDLLRLARESEAPQELPAGGREPGDMRISTVRLGGASAPRGPGRGCGRSAGTHGTQWHGRCLCSATHLQE